MKRPAALFALILGLVLVSCGGGGTPHPSGVKRRAFVTNSFNGNIQIINIDKDIGPLAQIPATGFFGVTPTFLVLSADKSTSVIFDAATNQVNVVDNTKESVLGSAISLPNWTESIVLSSDNKTGWAAVRNAVISNQPTTGVIAVLDLVNDAVSSQIPVPLVRHLALNHAATKLLAFADQSNLVYIVDLANNNAVTTASGFDRPVSAIFSSDDSTAYVLSCGAECGGTAAKVTALNMTTGTAGASVAVSGATVALLNGGNLYVAGSVPGCSTLPCGFLNVVSVANMTVTNTAPVPIGDGHHGVMALTGNGKLYVGATNCTNLEGVGNSGCLSIYDTAAASVKVPDVNCGGNPGAPALTCGAVTAIQPISGRNVVYIIQGGELVMYDSTASALQGTQVDLVGKSFDVKEVDD